MKPWLIAVLFAAALTAGLAVGVLSQRAPELGEHVTVLNAPRAIPPVSLLDTAGDTFTPEDFEGRWHLLFFGFTNCPDICPTTLAEMAALAKQSPAVAEQVGRVFVSVDPQRDTPAVMRQYTAFFDADIVGITGSEAQINLFTAALGIPHAIVPLDGEPGAYTVDHSASLVVLNPQGRIAAYISPPHSPESLANDLRAIIAGAKI